MDADILLRARKKLDYKVYENALGGHYSNRMDDALAIESRKEIYEFLAKYLHPGWCGEVEMNYSCGLSSSSTATVADAAGVVAVRMVG